MQLSHLRGNPNKPFGGLGGGSPGIVVMGRDSHFEGCGFESQHHILDGHFFTYICCKNCIVSLKRPKLNKKRGRGWPIFKKNHLAESPVLVVMEGDLK